MNNEPQSLHVTDAATLQHEPGATVADHMTRTGAFGAVLAVAAIGAPRLRAGFTLSPDQRRAPNPSGA
jgi:hypothetical protein